MKLSRRKRKKVKLFRVARSDDAWAWVDWKWAGDDGRFHERFDDPKGQYRVLYAGRTLRACLLEVLAHFRPDPALQAEMSNIVEDGESTPTVTAGHLGYEWAADRRIGTARATAHTCVITDAETIAWLRNTLKIPDLDAAMLKDARERAITQAASRALFEADTCEALEYRSRHGDNEQLWAIYERKSTTRADCLTTCETSPFATTHPDVAAVFAIYGLSWKAAEVPSAQDIPAPIATVSVEDFYARAFAETNGVPSPVTPVGCVWLWLDALNREDEAKVKALTHQPEHWSDADWLAAHQMQSEALAFQARTIPVIDHDAIPSNIAQAVHVPLGKTPLPGALPGGYETFGVVPENVPLVYATAIKLRGTIEWKVTGLGYEAPMPALWFNGPSPRAARGSVTRHHLEQVRLDLENLDRL